MTSGGWLRVTLGAVCLIGLGLHVAFGMEVTTDITHFLPASTDERLATVSRAVASSDLTKTMILTIGGPNSAAAARGAAGLANRLRGHHQVAWMRTGIDEGLRRSVHELYFPRRLMLLSPRPEDELPARLSDQGLVASAAELKRRLATPAGSLVRSLAPADPLLGFQTVVRRLQRAQAGSLELVGDQLMTAGGERGVIFLSTKAPAFDSRAQAELLEDISRAFAELPRDSQGALDLEQAGAARFAIASERSIKADIARISIVSSLSIIALFVVVFRSPRYLVLGLLPLAAGVLAAASVGLALFGRLHGLTLAFGATLIGVCIDFSVHLINHHTGAPDEGGPESTARRIWPALALGALTTVVGLVGLAWTELPGIREIAVFASVGVLSALIVTRYLLPPLLPRKPRVLPLQQRLAAGLSRLVFGLSQRRLACSLVFLSALALCAVFLPRLRFVDDVAALNTMDPVILEEDQRVRGQVSQMDPGRLVVSLGRTEEQALQRNDQVAERLDQAMAEGLLEGFRSIHSFLFSTDLQRRNRLLVTSSTDLFDRTMRALESEGFRPALFEPFRAVLEDDGPGPLEYDDLVSSPLRNLVQPFRIEVGDEVAFLTFVRGVSQPQALAERLADLPGVLYFDQMDFLDQTYGRCRSRTLELMVVGMLAVLLMVFVRYRKPALALCASAPALLAAGTTLAVTAALGVEANLLHLLGLLLALSMGVDYGVFMVESSGEPRHLAATALSLVTACLSTVLSFGLLGMSANPALKALGLTTALGVLLSLLFAPLAVALFVLPGETQGRGAR